MAISPSFCKLLRSTTSDLRHPAHISNSRGGRTRWFHRLVQKLSAGGGNRGGDEDLRSLSHSTELCIFQCACSLLARKRRYGTAGMLWYFLGSQFSRRVRSEAHDPRPCCLMVDLEAFRHCESQKEPLLSMSPGMALRFPEQSLGLFMHSLSARIK